MLSVKLKKNLAHKLSVLTAATMLTAVTPAYAELIISNGANSSQNVNATVINQSGINQTGANQAAVNQAKPSKESVMKLMQVMRIDQQIQAVIDGKQKAADILQNQSEDKKGDKKVLEAKMKGILTEYAQIVVGSLQSHGSVESLTQAYIESAQAHYTQQEVDAIIGFYDTAVGQSILDKNPKVTADFMQKSLPDDDQMQQTQDQLEQMLPQLQQLMKDVF
ncbi:DUF2059 domain-containing protein [Psychrobacter sp. FDAARGOS_221]|uniref:DUF2059 domain-containing protein n=1 Tax=Psychrobacter sp. FDAARGOS_221 TaxID=1975705 RepID=UPI00187D2D88|nr:DUF2059 domain-containing protein [Psychrobacter sp. FDAARGOS_221]